VYVSAVTRSERCPTKAPISAHDRPWRCSRLIRRCLRSCGEKCGIASALQARAIEVRRATEKEKARSSRDQADDASERHKELRNASTSRFRIVWRAHLLNLERGRSHSSWSEREECSVRVRHRIHPTRQSEHHELGLRAARRVVQPRRRPGNRGSSAPALHTG
jgi:hypothetical protein